MNLIGDLSDEKLCLFEKVGNRSRESFKHFFEEKEIQVASLEYQSGFHWNEMVLFLLFFYTHVVHTMRSVRAG